MSNLIDRRELINQINDDAENFIGHPTAVALHNAMVEYALDLIKEAPAVEAEPVRHGRWTDEHKCSVCGGVTFSEYNVYPVYDFDCNGETFFAVDYGYDLVYHETDFCPFCGAKMN